MRFSLRTLLNWLVPLSDERWSRGFAPTPQIGRERPCSWQNKKPVDRTMFIGEPSISCVGIVNDRGGVAAATLQELVGDLDAVRAELTKTMMLGQGSFQSRRR
jgi:hypothetical protein